jgi:L-cysteine S-thiosulfotransferase
MRLAAAALLVCFAGSAAAAEALPGSLTGAKGDPARGRAIILDRQVGMCLLCHSGPFPEEPFQGNLARDLRNAARLTEGEIRQRIVDPARIDPGSIMPAYYRSQGLARVAPAYRGKTILSAAQVEDVVAYLVSLRD